MTACTRRARRASRGRRPRFCRRARELRASRPPTISGREDDGHRRPCVKHTIATDRGRWMRSGSPGRAAVAARRSRASLGARARTGVAVAARRQPAALAPGGEGRAAKRAPPRRLAPAFAERAELQRARPRDPSAKSDCRPVGPSARKRLGTARRRPGVERPSGFESSVKIAGTAPVGGSVQCGSGGTRRSGT